MTTVVNSQERQRWLFGLALAAAAAIGAASTVNPMLTAGAVIGVLGVTVLFALPLHLLPAASLTLFALVPAQYLPTMGGTFSPALGAVVVLLVRHVGDGGRFRMDGVLALWAAAGTLLCLATFASPLRSSSAAWSINAILLVLVLSLLVRELPGAADAVVRTWLWLGGGLGAYALLELVLSRNPLMDPLYHANELEQGWSIYRATTTLGHPLVNGVFFAVASVLGIAMLATRIDRRTWILTLLSMGGVAASGSRGALVALAVGVVLMMLRSARSGRNNAALVLLLVVVGVPAVQWVGQRGSSAEGTGSTAVRTETLRDGLLLWQQHPLFGAGPGIADALKQQMTIGDRRRGIESSWLQLGVSIGVVGMAILLLLVGVSLHIGRKSVTRGLGAALVVYLVAIASFNLIESLRPALVMLGLLIGLGLAGGAEARVVAGSAVHPRHLEEQRTAGLTA